MIKDEDQHSIVMTQDEYEELLLAEEYHHMLNSQYTYDEGGFCDGFPR